MPRLLSAAALVLSVSTAHAQLDWVADHPGTLRYRLDLTDVQQHELHVTAAFPAVGPGPFTVRMPRASPGRYAEHNFAKNVYDLTATGAGGQALEVYPDGLGAWTVSGHGGAVTLTYTLFANGGDGTYAQIDDRRLHLNMPACFLYGEQLNDRPVLLELPADQRPEWEVATQLVPVAGARAFAAPDYSYFYDSPTLAGAIMRDSFAVRNPDGASQTIEVAMMHEGTREAFDAYVDDVEQVVLAQQGIYGELPAFDYGRYTFLCAYSLQVRGDGMEHRNSTICSSTASLAEAAERLIGTVSHEFFHCWNVERIRPASLEPFDFAHANVSGELWFAEGFTSYYDDLALVRAGLTTVDAYAASLADQLNYVLLSPGRDHRGPVAMSQQAPFVDAATSVDPDNFANTFVSYYPYGATLGLALDLQLRARDHTLDEVMRLMWTRFGKPEIPYHVRDIQLAVGEVIGDADWAREWFERHVYGSALPALDELMRPYGLALEPARPDSAGFYRLSLEERDGKVVVIGVVLENSPLYAAGVNEGSVLLELDGQPLRTLTEWAAEVGRLRVGEEAEVRFELLGEEKVGVFEARASPELVVRVREDPSKKELQLREAWLGR